MQISPKTAGKTRVFKNQYVILLFVGLTVFAGLYFFQAFGSGRFFHQNSSELLSRERYNGQKRLFYCISWRFCSSGYVKIRSAESGIN